MLGDLGKLIVSKGFKKLPKIQKIARSGHTEYNIFSWKSSKKCWMDGILTADVMWQKQNVYLRVC